MSMRTCIPAGPFLEWLDGWRQVQDEARGVSSEGFSRPSFSLEDLARFGGTSSKRFRDSRRSGRISIVAADAVLVRASDDMLETLWPEHLYPELYEFGEEPESRLVDGHWETLLRCPCGWEAWSDDRDVRTSESWAHECVRLVAA